MTEPILDCSRIIASIGQGVAASVPEHVGVNLVGESGARASALNKPIDGVRGERAAALSGKDVPLSGARLTTRAALTCSRLASVFSPAEMCGTARALRFFKAARFARMPA
jgi:hypothetical protein